MEKARDHRHNRPDTGELDELLAWTPSPSATNCCNGSGVDPAACAGAARPTQRRIAAGPNTRRGFLDALEDAFAQANSDSATLLVAMLGHGMVRREDFFFLSNDGTGRGDHERDVLLPPAAVHPPPRHTQQPLHQRRFDPQPLPGCGGAARRAGDDLDVPPETGEFDADRSASEYYGADQASRKPSRRSCSVSQALPGSGMACPKASRRRLDRDD